MLPERMEGKFRPPYLPVLASRFLDPCQAVSRVCGMSECGGVCGECELCVWCGSVCGEWYLWFKYVVWW